MRAAALLCLFAAGCAAAPSRGGGIVSTNPCADAMLVELVPPERIAAISHYSKDPMSSSISPEVAARFRGTRGSAEEVVAMRPDLVIASSFTGPATRGAYARAGLKTLYLDSPTTVEASKAQVTELAAALGAAPQGRAMNARIDRAVVAAARSDAPVPAIVWIGGNMASGGGNLLNQLLRLAGFEDRAAHYGLQFTGYLPIENIAIDPPRVMLVPAHTGRDAASRAAQMRGRILAHFGAKVTQAEFPRDLVNCGGPPIARAMDRLAQVRRSVQ
jgi:iron complex transport system substrate-binding protein